MPIDLRKHDPDGPITIRPEANKAKIIKLLYGDTNLDTPQQKSGKRSRGSASTTLSRLHDERLIGKTSDGLYHGFDHRTDRYECENGNPTRTTEGTRRTPL